MDIFLKSPIQDRSWQRVSALLVSTEKQISSVYKRGATKSFYDMLSMKRCDFNELLEITRPEKDQDVFVCICSLFNIATCINVNTYTTKEHYYVNALKVSVIFLIKRK